MADGSSGGPAGNIKIFMRLRPSKRPSGYFHVNPDSNQLEFNTPSAVEADTVNNSRTSHKFKFTGLFDMSVTQDVVFEAVAREAVDSALDGYNSTIFAYGQTGSGKTFTITGGAERYQDRGIIPRTLARVFQTFKARTDMHYSAYISYLEVYNEVGYDLLDPSHETKALEELPRVTLMEDEEGSVHLKNLSMHAATNEEEALNLLFLGDTNRAIAETPMNMASSRSHCIFTISLEARQEGSAAVRRSKLHLVDLAGSERVHKTNASGQLFREASHINKSLHFLEMVIVALQELKRGVRSHIPYRNSMMTSVLRDSLGGNCKTTMIATINPEPEHTNESISTCRFAQRVALVKNSATVNEEADPTLLIRQLKSKLQGVEAEVKFLKGEAGEESELADRDWQSILAAAQTWVRSPSDDELSIGKLTMTRIKAAFRALRQVARESASSGAASGASSPRLLLDAGGGGAGSGSKQAVSKEEAAAAASLKEDVRQLRAQVQMRDNEIAILVNMVKTAKATASASAALNASGGGAGGAGRAAGPGSAGGGPAGAAAPPPGFGLPPFAPLPLPGMTMMMAPPPQGWSPWPGSSHPPSSSAPTTSSAFGDRTGTGADSPGSFPAGAAAPQLSGASSVAIMLANGAAVDGAVLKDRDRAFDAFRAAYPKAETIEANKRVLKEKYEAAKALAERVNQARAETNRLKAEIERKRVERAMSHIVDGKTGDDADGAAGGGGGGDSKEEADAEAELKAEMDGQKDEYKASFAALRDLKAEIEHVQRLLETNRLRLQADFESWYSNSLQRVQQQADADAAAAATPGGGGSGGGVSRGSTAPAFMPGAATPPGFPGAAAFSGGYLMPGQVAMPPLPPGYFGLGAGGFGGPGSAMMVPFAMQMPPGVTVPSAVAMGAVGPPQGEPLQSARSTASSSTAAAPTVGRVGTSGASSSAPAEQQLLLQQHASGSRGPASSASSVRSRSSDTSVASSTIPPLTGNAAADADILAFYKAKEELLRRRSGAAGNAGLSSVLADAASLSASINNTRASSAAGGSGK